MLYFNVFSGGEIMFDRYSRLSIDNLYDHRGTLMHKNDIRRSVSNKDCTIHIFRGGDRIDSLSYAHYGTYDLGWVIMYANPKYRREEDIKSGDAIIIPNYNEVLKCLKKS